MNGHFRLPGAIAFVVCGAAYQPKCLFTFSVTRKLNIHQAAGLSGVAIRVVILRRDDFVNQVELILQGTIQLFQLPDAFEELFLPVRCHSYILAVRQQLGSFQVWDRVELEQADPCTIHADHR